MDGEYWRGGGGFSMRVLERLGELWDVGGEGGVAG